MKFAILTVLAVAAITVAPSRARAQLVDVTDPCFIALFGTDGKSILATGSSSNRAHLEAGALAIRTNTSSLLKLVREILKDGISLTPAQLEGLRAQNRCLPWLERQLGLILDQLKRIGVQGIALPDQRQHVPIEQFVHVPIEQFVKDVVDELKEAERLLAQVLKVR